MSHYNHYKNEIKEDNGYHLKVFVCPICGGVGTVPANFYSKDNYTTANNEISCKSCSGKGVLWG